MTVNDVFEWLNQIAPFETQEAFDNSGLLAGDPSAVVRKVLFTLDVTKPAIAEAVNIGAELIISHHPLMFHPVQQIRYDREEGAVIRLLTASGLSLIAAHTNLDQCNGGMSDSLAQTLALKTITACDANPYLRTGTLSSSCTAKEFLFSVSSRLSASVRMYGDAESIIRSVAVAPGAGGDMVPDVDADAFVTGEIKHHELLNACGRGLAIFDAGHYPTEFPGIAALYQRFLAAAAGHGWAMEAALYSRPPYPCLTHA